MQTKLMLEWADELENTDKEQCQYYLRRENSRCCIGIFGDMMGLDLGNPRTVYETMSEVSGLDNEVFWSMNDSHGMSFKEIAVEIRKMVAEKEE